MIKSQIFKAAHAEARTMCGINYAEAFKYGLRRVYNKIEKDRFIAAVLAEPKQPKFMWLRGI